MRFALLVVVFLAACTSGLDIDPPVNGMQLKTEPMEVPAGKEVLLCTYLKPLDKELMLKAITFHQTEGGHHVALFSVITPQASGTRDCTDPNTPEGAAQMANWRPVAAGSNHALPAGVGLKIPSGKQLMMQSHFVNTTGDVME